MRNLSLLLFIALLIFVIFGENKPPQSGDTTKINGKKYEVIKEVHDTIRVTKIIQGKTLPTIINTIHDTIPQKVDTSAILSDYFAKNIFADTIRLDTNGFVFISDTVQKNKIIGRYFMSHIIERQVNNTMIVKPVPTWHLYAGFDVSLDRIEFINRVGGNILFQKKNGRMIGLGTGLTSKATPYISFQYYFKLK